MSDVLENLYQAVLNANTDLAKESAKEALKQKIDPLKAVEEGLVRGVREVGVRFGKGELFLTDLIMGAEAFKAALSILEPELAKKKVEMRTVGTVVLGTVAGDIHSIGKDIVAVLLSANGFKVHDLGVDVPVEKFVEATKEYRPDIVGASALMSTTIPEQQKIVKALKENALRSKVKFMIGGAGVSESWAKEIGADAWALAADEAVEKARELVGS
jgi:corrinoid protein of di/trimethylamine methyltransferase